MDTDRTTLTAPPAPAGDALPRAGDPRALFATAVELAGGVVGAVRPDQLGGATPCDDLDVRQLLGHLVEVLRRVTALGRGQDPFDLPGSGGTADDGWPAAWRSAAHEVQAAWADDAVLEREMTLPWVQAPGRIILLGYVSEITVHTWDLASATGQQPAWDLQVLDAAFASIRAVLPAEDRQALFDAVLPDLPPGRRGGPPPFGEAVPVDADASLLHRLVAWTGRRP